MGKFPSRCYASLVLAALAVSACTATAPTPVIDYAAIIEAAPRLGADSELDSARHPAKILSFARVQPGETVVEIEAGRGYYTALLSEAVGPNGQVHMINPPFFDTFIPDKDLTARLGMDGQTLPNVTLHRATQFDAIPLADNSADLVTWILGPHEVYFNPPGDYSFGDPDTTWREIARVLKPGGRALMIDHMACNGAGTTVGGTLHRVEARSIMESAERVGLRLTHESDALMTGQDDCAVNVFDPKVRRKTDRFVMLFVAN